MQKANVGKSRKFFEIVVSIAKSQFLYRDVKGARIKPNVLRTLYYGEFDPGSGRTLAACLTHASQRKVAI